MSPDLWIPVPTLKKHSDMYVFVIKAYTHYVVPFALSNEADVVVVAASCEI